MSRIFISYKRVDKEKVFKIKDQIESALGEKCWIDLDGIESDEAFVEKIITAIDACEVFLFMYSAQHADIKDYQKDWTVRELQYAEREGKRIVFVNIDGSCLSKWFSFMFGAKQQVDGTSDDAICKLFEDLEGWLFPERIAERERKLKEAEEKARLKLQEEENERIQKEAAERARIAAEEKARKERETKERVLRLEKERAKNEANQKEKDRLRYTQTSNTYNRYSSRKTTTHTKESSNFILVIKSWVENSCIINKAWSTIQIIIGLTIFCFFVYLLSKCDDWINKEENVEVVDENIRDVYYNNNTLTIGPNEYKMVRVEAGTFTMGKSQMHNVTLDEYYIGETEVTQAMWVYLMGRNKEKQQWKVYSGDIAAYSISWNDCQEFINKLNKITGKHFRMPTETEWEFAARGGNYSNHTKYAGSNSIEEVAWYWDKSWFEDFEPHYVAKKKPNELGLYDMSGNVWEWCQDWYSEELSNEVQNSPTGPKEGTKKVIRGGWDGSYDHECMVTYRSYMDPNARSSAGLRLVLSN